MLSVRDNLPSAIGMNERTDEPASSQALPPPRTMLPRRDQLIVRQGALDATVSSEHPVRDVWRFVEGLDLEPLRASIKARQGRPGRPAIDPSILVALWLWATIDAVGSAREIARLCREHDVYRWLLGGVTINHHTLSDFRTAHEHWLDDQLTRSVAALMALGAVTLRSVAQDGMRVRAHAKAASFRRRETLEQLLDAARTQLECVKRESDVDAAAFSARRRAARLRSAREREQRAIEALAVMHELEQARTGTPPEDTDDDAAPPPSPPPPGAATSDPVGRRRRLGRCPGRGQQEQGQAASGQHHRSGLARDEDGRRRLPACLERAVRCRRRHRGDRRGGAGQPRQRHAPDEADVRAGVQPLRARARHLAGRRRLRPARLDRDARARRHRGARPRRRRRASTGSIAMRESPRTATRSAPGGSAWARRLRGCATGCGAATVECANAHARGRGLTHFELVGASKARCVALWHALAELIVAQPAR